MVPSQLNVLHRAGQGDHHRRDHEGHAQRGFMPDTNMWWPHTMKPSPAMPDRVDHRLVTEERLAGERADDIETMPIAGRIMMYTAGCE
jgi:hypothetical protein